MQKREPIVDVLQNNDVDPSKKDALTEVLVLREFAISELYLPDNNSYQDYVELDRDYVSWAVFAAQEFSLQAKTWCFWVVGCVPYRGYFSEQAAQEFSLQLRADAYEVYIAPIPAYSTLGWFRDPVLSSMLRQGEIATAEYIFHELAHQKVYIPSDADFNEAFATMVAEQGVILWLQSHDANKDLEKYRENIAIKIQLHAFVKQFKHDLGVVYDISSDAQTKAQKKQLTYAQFTADILAWADTNKKLRYAEWLLKDLNNAKLNAMSTYRNLVPAFHKLFERCDNDFTRFYAQIEGIIASDPEKRIEALKSASCSG